MNTNPEVRVAAFETPMGDASAQERHALALAEAEMAKLETQFTQWWALFDDTSPYMAPRAEVVELMETAPNAFALGVFYGLYTMRLEIAAMTKREWV